MKCPQCNYLQICPCKFCFSSHFKSSIPWIWVNQDYIQCSNCKLTKSVDWWEEEAQKQ